MHSKGQSSMLIAIWGDHAVLKKNGWNMPGKAQLHTSHLLQHLY